MALMFCAVTAQMICAFVFANANGRFSHNAAQFNCSSNRQYPMCFINNVLRFLDNISSSINCNQMHLKTKDHKSTCWEVLVLAQTQLTHITGE